MRPAGEHEPGPSYAISRESPIDLRELRKLSDPQSNHESEEMVGGLIELFFQIAPQNYALVRGAHAEGDAQSLGRAAHKLKSQAAFFGAQRLAWICRQLERLGYGDRLEGCEKLVDDLEDELDRVMLALSRHRLPAK